MAISPRPPSSAQRAEAARWLVRLDRGLRDPAEQQRFTTWLDADPRHGQALAEAQALWQGLEGPARILAAARPIAATRRRRPWLAAAGALAVAVLAVLVPLLGDVVAWLGDWRADFVSSRGQIRVVDLPDGSVLTLAGNSAVALGFAADQRRVSLLRGEAFFSVHPDAARPFVVVAGGSWVRVVGTAFDVRRDRGRIAVAVEHGVVDVGAEGGGTQRLHGGQAVEVTEGGPGPVVAAGPAGIGNWRDGRMVFFRQPLSEVVAALQAQSTGAIVVADRSLAGRSVSGSFPAQDVHGTLSAISDTLGVRLVHMGPFLTVLY